MDPDYLLSIDLGTSHVVAVLRGPGATRRTLLFDGSPLLPAGVHLDEAGELHVGRDAQRLASGSPERFEPHPKRRLAEGSILLGDTELGVVEVFTAVLARVARVCAESTGAIPPVVLTHPSTWSERRVGLMREAAAQAGYDSVESVTEPVAAAHYYEAELGHRIGPGEALAVVDIGAGTVDIALLTRSVGEALTVVAEGGLPDLGGIDIDAAIVAHLRGAAGDGPELWAALERPSTAGQRRDRTLLWGEAREAKEMLSRTTTAPIAVPGREAALHLTRGELDALAEPLLAPMARELRRLSTAVERGGRTLAGVFLVGGAARMPLVASMIHREFELAPVLIERPELAVAEGAAALRTTVNRESDGGRTDERTPDQVVASAVPPLPPPPARRDRRRLPLAAAVAVSFSVLAVIAVLAFRLLPEGQSGAGGEERSGEAVAPADLACVEGTEAFDAASGSLRGPHFELQPSCAGLLSVDQATALAEALDVAVEVAGAQRLAVVHFSAAAQTSALPEGAEHEVRTAIALGEHHWEFAGVPIADTVYFGVVEEDDTASASVTDADREQTLDLLTGEIGDPIEAYYHGELGERSFEVAWWWETATSDGDWTGSAVYSEAFTVGRQVFDEEEGWLAEPDAARVTVSFRDLYATDLGSKFVFDPVEQLRIRTADGDIKADDVEEGERGLRKEGTDWNGHYRELTVHFTVPGDLTSLQFVYEPTGEYYSGDIEETMYAQSGDQTQYHEADFTA